LTAQLALVALGGAIGSVIRYLLQTWLNPVAGRTPPRPVHEAATDLASAPAFFSAFPLGTFLVNIIGCLLIGMLFSLTARFSPHSETLRLFGITGVMGGFTTFSAFSLESVQLLRQDRPGLFLAYVSASILVCLIATFIGIKLIRS